MLKYFWKKRGQRGFTLIELVVVLAILGILIALAVPRYLGARRSALMAEGDNVLQEMKTLSWAYYQQYSTWLGITNANVNATIGLSPPSGGCWTYGLPGNAGAATILLRAQSTATPPARCGPLGGAANVTITLTLNGGGDSSLARVITVP